LEDDHPGRISNEKLLKDFNKYLRDDDPNEPCNFVIKGKTREGIDYKMLPKGAWIPMLKRFGGLELIRFKDSDVYNRKFTIKFCPVSLI
jgi:hypothetical protein